MQGVIYDPRYRSSTSGLDLVSLLPTPISAPHPTTIRPDVGLDDLHVSSSALLDNIPKEPYDEATLEIFWRCNGQRRWVSAQGMKGQVCENTGSAEGSHYTPPSG